MVRSARFLVVPIVFALGTTVPGAQSPGAAQQPTGLTAARALAAGGKHADALALLETAVSNYARAGDRKGEAEAELLRSTSLRAAGDRPAALKAAERTLLLAAGADLQVRALVQLARIHSDGGQEAAAAGLLQRAWTLAHPSGDAKLAMQVGEARAANARALGNGADAVRAFGDVIAAADRSGSLDFSVRARSGRSSALLGLGRFDEALVDGERASALAAKAPARLRANATFALAQVHAHLWNLDRAAQLWEQAIALYREAGLQIGVALSLRQSMDTWFALRDFERAFKDGSAALALYERSGSQGSTPDTLARLALIQVRRGDRASARTFADRARSLSADVPARRRIFIENDLGLLELYGGRPDAAAVMFEGVLTLAREQQDSEYEWRALYGLGRSALARGRAPEAQPHLQDAVAIVERMRKGLPAPEQRASFMTQRLMVYHALIDALMARSAAPGDWFARRAFDVAETGRARALADQLAEAGSREADPAMRHIAAEEAASSRRLSMIQKSLRAETEPSRRAVLTRQLTQAEHDYESLVARARRDNPRRASMAWPQPVTASGVRTLLGPDEAIVAFAAGEQGGWAWAIRSGQLFAYGIPPSAEVDHLVRRLRSAAMNGDMSALQEAGLAASRVLFGPAAHVLRGATRLIVIPDGSLHRLPVAALRDFEDGWMIEKRAVSLAPSATVLASLRGRPVSASRQLLAFAAPRGFAGRDGPVLRGDGALPVLAHAEFEAREAVSLARGRSALRVPARERDVRDPAAGRYRVLHFATHAVVDERVPRRSAILVEADEDDDGLLQLNEIAHLQLDAPLVVLAACRSQMGRALQGEGLLSLSRAFLQAGARGVVASLWDVADDDSRRLLRAFYQHARRGVAADEALRFAQLDQLRAGGRGRPARWAAFVVSGDASAHVLDPFAPVPVPDRPLMAGGVTLGLLLAVGLFMIGRRA